ncbi:hypothetical protein F4818DRAFT_206027 [Hypoxylon cercidicola]|nr:hypothetical protein F4818DRAFT_206027 [Hypoxylon cercidicola]
MVFPNANMSEPHDYFTQPSLSEGQKPSYVGMLDVNLVGVVHTLTLARRIICAHGVREGSVVITISAVAYAPEQSLPVFAAPIAAMGLPIGEAMFVGRALVYAATATKDRKVEVYGKESEGYVWSRDGQKERWNGRVILTLGDAYSELEGPIADLRPFWAESYSSNWDALDISLEAGAPQLSHSLLDGYSRYVKCSSVLIIGDLVNRKTVCSRQVGSWSVIGTRLVIRIDNRILLI